MWRARVDKARVFDEYSRLEEYVRSDGFRRMYETRVAEVVTPTFAAIVVAGIKSGDRIVRKLRAKDTIGAFPDIDLDTLADETIRSYVPKFTSAIGKTTYKELSESIIRARASGAGLFGVIEDSRRLFGPERAMRIATTETTRLFGMASQATYKALGAERWEWQTVRDARVCPICEGLNGSTYDIDEAFGPAHVSCRCFPRPAAMIDGIKALSTRS